MHHGEMREDGFLGETLKLKEICLHVVHISATTLDAIINFFEEIVGDAINLIHHLLALILFSETNLVVEGLHLKCLFEDP